MNKYAKRPSSAAGALHFLPSLRLPLQPSPPLLPRPCRSCRMQLHNSLNCAQNVGPKCCINCFGNNSSRQIQKTPLQTGLDDRQRSQSKSQSQSQSQAETLTESETKAHGKSGSSSTAAATFPACLPAELVAILWLIEVLRQ